MTSEKFLIILFYYNRPNLVRAALDSVKCQSYTDWEIAFIDDGSDVPGEPIAREVLGPMASKVTFYRSNDTPQDKLNRNGVNGSHMGKYANEAIAASNAKYVIMLCDDDALYGEYLRNLQEWFTANPAKNYVYSHIKQYNPPSEVPQEPLEFRDHHLNRRGAINPYYALDMSQVAWRRDPYVAANISFPYPFTVNIDAEVYTQMMKVWGHVEFSGFIGQYKAIHTDNLSHRMGRVIYGGNKNQGHVYEIGTK